MDEFIFLKNYTNIKYFLNNKRFIDCNIIHLNWVNHLDNNQIYYKNDSLSKRFPRYKYNRTYSFVNIYLYQKKRKYFNEKYESCNGFGLKKKFLNIIHTEKPDYEYYYIDHYYFKSTEEFIDKINRGDCFYGNNIKMNFYWIKIYFSINEITLKKINYFEKKTGINLSYFRKYIK